jgi:hypothetical protein
VLTRRACDADFGQEQCQRNLNLTHDTVETVGRLSSDRFVADVAASPLGTTLPGLKVGAGFDAVGMRVLMQSG